MVWNSFIWTYFQFQGSENKEIQKYCHRSTLSPCSTDFICNIYLKETLRGGGIVWGCGQQSDILLSKIPTVRPRSIILGTDYWHCWSHTHKWRQTVLEGIDLTNRTMHSWKKTPLFHSLLANDSCCNNKINCSIKK